MVPRPELTFRFFEHGQTGREGILAYIPTEGLAAGQHTITVRQPPRRPTSRRRGPLPPFEITFWR